MAENIPPEVMTRLVRVVPQARIHQLSILQTGVLAPTPNCCQQRL
jgi:hypothetical protein